MLTTDTSNEPTPNGGVSSKIYYYDDQMKPVDKSKATKVEIIEYDAKGDVIHRTYANIER